MESTDETPAPPPRPEAKDLLGKGFIQPTAPNALENQSKDPEAQVAVGGLPGSGRGFKLKERLKCVLLSLYKGAGIHPAKRITKIEQVTVTLLDETLGIADAPEACEASCHI